MRMGSQVMLEERDLSSEKDLEVFQKEARTLESAREALDSSPGLEERTGKAFRALVKGYARLLRQSRRMVTMGDRMQLALNELNREIGASEAKYRSVFESVNEGIYRCAPDGGFVEVNPAMASMFGFEDSAAFLKEVASLEDLFDCRDTYDRYLDLLSLDCVHRHEVRVCRPGCEALWAEVSASVIRDEESQECTGVVGVMADVTERKRMLEEMCRLARTDSLTGLFSRGHFMELAGREVARCRRNLSPLSLLIVDVDYFKCVNDTFGHDVGDQALIALASVMRRAVREVDVIGRLGGEEFVVLLPDAGRQEAVAVSERVVEAVRARVIECSEGEVALTVSVGVTPWREGDDLDDLLKFADIALYAAKKKGRDRVEAYQHEAHADEADKRAGRTTAVAGGGR